MPRRRKTTEDLMNGSTPSEKLQYEFLAPTINRFAEDTSMLGFRYLHTRYKTWFRFIWALLLIFFVGLTIYQVFERIGYYFIRNPLITQRTYETPNHLLFPVVLICNKMQLKSSKVARLRPDLLRTMSLMYEDDGSPTVNETVWDMLNAFDPLDLPYVYRNAYQTAEDFFMSCQYGKGNPCLDDIQPVLTPNGVCFAVKNNLTVRRPGPETTLSLLLNLEVYEIIPGWVSEPGVMISMYDSSVPSSGYFGEGMHLEPGKVVTIPINDIRRLRRHDSECGQSNVVKGNVTREYSRVGCRWSFTYKHIERDCQCVPVRSPRNLNPVVDLKPDQTEYARPLDGTPNVSCSLREEFACVNKLLVGDAHPAEGDGAADRRGGCPEDCSEVSFTTIVFGNYLDVNEIASFLPSDWEEEKEKRLNNFQFAFDIIPTHRIPLVQNIQKLANEAQHFLRQALTTFGVVENATDAVCPCTNYGEEHSVLRSISQFHTHERLWRNFASYIDLVFRHHLGSLFNLLHIDVNADFTLRMPDPKDHREEPKNVIKKAEMAVFELQLFEESMAQPKTIFGLKSLKADESRVIVAKIQSMIHELQNCISEIRFNAENVEYYRRKCAKTFDEHFKTLRNAYSVSSVLSANAFGQYESLIKKVTQTLRQTEWVTQPKIFQWKNFNINLRQFETLYSDGGKESASIHDLLKLRKLLQTDIAVEIQETMQRVERALSAREKFLSDAGIVPAANLSISQIRSALWCMRSLLPRIELLKKSNFLRAEWMSRLQRQVTIAKAYSPSKQYDEINLLFVKIYFAHFKQELIVQERSYNLFLLLAEIGGTIGLYVGASILTVAETLVFFIEKRTRRLFIKPADV